LAGGWFRARLESARLPGRDDLALASDVGFDNMFCMFCGLVDRSLPNTHPYDNLAIRADGREPING
jgi:hypothetical protein